MYTSSIRRSLLRTSTTLTATSASTPSTSILSRFHQPSRSIVSSSSTSSLSALTRQQRYRYSSTASSSPSEDPSQSTETPSNTSSTSKDSSSSASSSTTGTASSTATKASLEEAEKKVKELEGMVKDLKSQLTYGKADFINLQRRSELEKVSAREYAIQPFALDLLSTVDILSTALKYVPQPIPEENTALKALFSGVTMTRSELIKTLGRHGVTEFDPTGEKFDPNVHEALFQAPVPGKQPGSVLECQKTGFMLKGRTLRPAQVGVVQDV